MNSFIHQYRMTLSGGIILFLSFLTLIELLSTRILAFLNDLFLILVITGCTIGIIILITGLIIENKDKANSKVVHIIKQIVSFILLLPLALFLTVSFKYLFGFNMLVVGNSMEPTLYDGDEVIVVLNHRYSRGDIIVADIDTAEYNVIQEKLFIKRVIGISGDKIKVVEKGMGTDPLNLHQPVYQYEFWIDDVKICDHIEPLNNALAIDSDGYLLFKYQNEWVNVIPSGYLYALGDNRTRSTDSRIIGVVREKDIIGHVDYKMINLLEKERL